MSKNIKIKPGKGYSGMGVVMGIIFCLIGFCIVIPVAGLFGVLWTLIAIVITVMNALNAFSDKGFATQEIIIDEEESGSGRIEERLKRLEQLYNQGMITKEEYDKKRQSILDEI